MIQMHMMMLKRCVVGQASRRSSRKRSCDLRWQLRRRHTASCGNNSNERIIVLSSSSSRDCSVCSVNASIFPTVVTTVFQADAEPVVLLSPMIRPESVESWDVFVLTDQETVTLSIISNTCRSKVNWDIRFTLVIVVFFGPFQSRLIVIKLPPMEGATDRWTTQHIPYLKKQLQRIYKLSWNMFLWLSSKDLAKLVSKQEHRDKILPPRNTYLQLILVFVRRSSRYHALRCKFDNILGCFF